MSHSPETPPDRPKLWPRVFKRAGSLIVVCAVVPYLLILIILGTFQRYLIYSPSKVAQLSISDLGFAEGCGEDISLKTADGLQLHGWHLLPSLTNAAVPADFGRLLKADHKVLIFFPGNGGNRSDRDLDLQLLADLGLHTILFDYRGYGENLGEPTEENLAADSRAIRKYATETREVPHSQIILYGESLGGGVATRLAEEMCVAGTPPAGLILRSTFTSMADAAGFHYPWLPVRWMLMDRFQSDQRIGRVTAPLLILHGAHDEIVPLEQGKQLFRLAPEKSTTGIPKTFLDLSRSGHNDVLLVDPARFREGIEQFIERL